MRLLSRRKSVSRKRKLRLKSKESPLSSKQNFLLKRKLRPSVSELKQRKRLPDLQKKVMPRK